MNAAAYARYSTDNQTENSIAYQLDKIQKYCLENSITLTAFFIDEAQSGTNAERAGFMNMIQAARRKEFEAVIIYDISRGSRDVADWFNFRKTMAALNIQVISCTQKLGNIYNSNDFLVELISVGLGQREVLETRQKSMDGVAIKAKQGQFLGGVAPLGYTIVDGQYVIDPVEAPIVRKIFSMYAAGHSYDEILKEIGPITGRYGRPLGKNSLYSILKNERYNGTYFWNKRKMKLFRKWAGGQLNPDVVRIENAIPAIVTPEIWEAAQMRLSDNKHNARNKAKREYLLSGLIKCSSCGSTYTGYTTTRKKNGKSYKYSYYICGNKSRTKTCNSPNINADEIETFVVAQLREYLRTADFKQIAQYIADQVNSCNRDVQSEKSELLKIDAKIKNGVNALLNGADIPELTAEIEKLRVRKSELEDIISNASINKKEVDPAAIEMMFKMAAENMSGENCKNLKTLIQAFIPVIYANPDGSATVQIGLNLGAVGAYSADNENQKKCATERLHIRQIAEAGFEPTTSGL